MIYSPKRNRFLVLRNWICEQFEGQIPEQWYSVSTSTTSATGYLYTAYRALRDQSLELGIFKGTVKEKSKCEYNIVMNWRVKELFYLNIKYFL